MKKIILSLMLYCATLNAQVTNYVLSYNGASTNNTLGTSVGTGVRSIEFWFKPAVTMSPSTSATGWTFISRDDNTQNSEYGVYIRGTDWTGFGSIGNLCFWVRYSGTLHEIKSNQNTWNAGTWYHIAGVIDPVSGMQLYVNGVLQTNTDPAATTAVASDNINPTYLGSWGSASRFYNGRMDEMRLWSRAISQNEIQTKMCQALTPANETGLRAYYQMDEGSGTQILDATANGYNGTVNNSTWIQDSPCPSSTGNYVNEYNGASNNSLGTSVGTGIRSIEFWFRPAVTMSPSTSATGWTFISRDDNSQFSEYGAYIRGTDWSGFGNIGNLCFWARYSGTLHEIKSNQNTWNAGTWYHIAGVMDPASGMKLYVNGVLQTDTDPSATSPVASDNINPTYLGSWGGGARYFNGRMDEMRLWNRAVSQNEIQTKMCQTLTPANETGLQAYYQFNEGSGSQILDATANAYNGSVNGTTWINDTYCANAIAETDFAKTFVLFPSPSNGIVHVSANSVNSIEYSITDEIGKTVQSGKIDGANATLSVESLSNGIYFVNLCSEEKTCVKKIIINK